LEGWGQAEVVDLPEKVLAARQAYEELWTKALDTSESVGMLRLAAARYENGLLPRRWPMIG